MKKQALLITFVLSAMVAANAQNCFRFTYLLQQKREVNEQTFHSNEMKLDFDGKLAFFYSEVSYFRDSLDVYAFDKSGYIADEDAYSQRTRLKSAATNDKSWIDFTNKTFTQYYGNATSFYGTMQLELPQWKITDEVEEKVGYSCKVATGSFLGREWTLWFTEEIPLNIGPWFLWGAPGLIVYAKDSEDIVCFSLVGVEHIEHSRFDMDNSYRKARESGPHSRVYSFSMKEMETMHTKYSRDSDYYCKINGLLGSYTKNRDGSVTKDSMKPYIPLIPDEYWQSK